MGQAGKCVAVISWVSTRVKPESNLSRFADSQNIGVCSIQVLMCVPQRFCKELFMSDMTVHGALEYAASKLRPQLIARALHAHAPTVDIRQVVLNKSQFWRELLFGLQFVPVVNRICMDATMPQVCLPYHTGLQGSAIPHINVQVISFGAELLYVRQGVPPVGPSLQTQCMLCDKDCICRLD